MKKFFIFAATLAVFGCSNNDEAIDKDQYTSKLVDAEIKVGMSKTQTTRSYLGDVTNDGGDYIISHSFQKNDEMLITDYYGQYPFKVVEGGSDGKIKGKWAAIDDVAVKNGILAAFPSSAVTNKVTVSENKPTMYFNLKTEQTPYVFEGGSNKQLSYDRDAGLAFACASSKDANLWFFPLVSYLYFYSEKPTCTITSTNEQGIAGNYTVTYSGTAGTGTNAGASDDYTSAEGLSKFLTYTADATTITCHGIHLTNHKNAFVNTAPDQYEYIIAIKPGVYGKNSLKITPDGASKSLYCPDMTLYPSYLYFIGGVDANPATPATPATPNP